MKQILGIILVAIVLAAISCRSAKKIQTAITKKDTTRLIHVDNTHADSLQFIRLVLNKIEANRIDFKTFSAKIKVNYKDKEGEQPELTVFVRMQRDSLIWISINASIFNYEALRVLITRDSVKVMNKKDKIVQLRSVSYLQDLTQLPFDFSTLQDFLVGSPVYLDSNVVYYTQNHESIVLMSVGRYFKHLVAISTNDYLIQHSKLDDADPNRSRTCDLSYGGYENKGGIKFATERRISVSEKSKLDIDMDVKQYSFNEILSYPFTIPKNYKRK